MRSLPQPFSFLLYPVLVLGSFASLVAAVMAGRFALAVGAACTLGAFAIVTHLERRWPYALEWNRPHGRDLATDLAHNAVNLGINQVTLLSLAFTAPALALWPVWPSAWPFAWQCVLVAVLCDAGIGLVHFWSHRSPFLWRLHAIHHTSERLYALNGERRHPLHHVLEGTLGLLPAILLGAPPEALVVFIATYSVHLLLQHANVAYDAGWLRFVFGVAQVHRFHHRRDTAHGSVNFGGMFVLVDHLLGTFLADAEAVAANGIGIEDPPDVPEGYAAQLRWPFEASRAAGSSPTPG